MKKRMCLFLILFIVGSVLAGNGMSARAAGDFLPRMAKLQEGSSVFDICVLKSDGSIYMSVDDLARYTGYTYQYEEQLFRIDSQVEPARRIKEVKLNLDQKTVTVLNSSYDLGGYYNYNGRLYLPAEDLLPLLDCKLSVGESGAMVLVQDGLFLWETLYQFDPARYGVKPDEVDWDRWNAADCFTADYVENAVSEMLAAVAGDAQPDRIRVLLCMCVKLTAGKKYAETAELYFRNVLLPDALDRFNLALHEADGSDESTERICSSVAAYLKTNRRMYELMRELAVSNDTAAQCRSAIELIDTVLTDLDTASKVNERTGGLAAVKRTIKEEYAKLTTFDVPHQETADSGGKEMDIYKKLFCSKYDPNNSLLYFADVNRDSRDEMIVISWFDDCYTIYGDVYRISESGETERIYRKEGSKAHTGEYFDWFLTEGGDGLPCLLEIKDNLFQGEGSLEYEVYFLDNKGGKTVEDSFSVSSDRPEDTETLQNGEVTLSGEAQARFRQKVTDEYLGSVELFAVDYKTLGRHIVNEPYEVFASMEIY